jgi:hypothetical protein
MNAVKCHKELRDYYLRKTEDGKSKMSALNAGRSKLLHIQPAFFELRNLNMLIQWLLLISTQRLQ